jgi:GNAT superfamily N-acetyltransferase
MICKKYNPNFHKLLVINGERSFVHSHGIDAILSPSELNYFWNRGQEFAIFVAEKNGIPAAYTMFLIDGNYLNLETIYTEQNFRGQGIMSKLMKYSLQQAKRFGLDITAQNLIDDIASDKMLLKFGFKIESIDENMYFNSAGKNLILPLKNL